MKGEVSTTRPTMDRRRRRRQFGGDDDGVAKTETAGQCGLYSFAVRKFPGPWRLGTEIPSALQYIIKKEQGALPAVDAVSDEHQFLADVDRLLCAVSHQLCYIVNVKSLFYGM
jgi:hypothetical protein